MRGMLVPHKLAWVACSVSSVLIAMRVADLAEVYDSCVEVEWM